MSPPEVPSIKTYELRDAHETRDVIEARLFSSGRFSDRCERGRANNVAMLARHRASDAASLGLVRAAYLTAWPDSRLVKLQLPTFGASEPPKCGTRGKVNGLSDESRRRLMMLLHSIERKAAMPAFVTLTLPDDRLMTPIEAKTALQTLFKRWKRRSPRLCAVWRLEAHPERSLRAGVAVPHFHLLVWGAWIDRNELSRDWAEVVGAPNFLAHLAAGTKVESIRSFRGVCSYAAKYISKISPVDLGSDAGRVWGIFNAEALPVGRAVTIKLDVSQMIAVVRAVKELLAARNVATDWLPRSIFIENPIAFLEGIVTSGTWDIECPTPAAEN